MKKRLCPHCGYKWNSDTAYGAVEMLDQFLIAIICVIMAILAWVYVPGWIEEELRDDNASP